MYHIAAYSQNDSEIHKATDISEVKKFLGKHPVTWLHISHPKEKDIKSLAEIFGFHHLSLEDSIKFKQRPKFEDYDNYFFLTINLIEYSKSVEVHQLAMFVGDDYVVTICEKENNCIDGVLKRIESKNPRILANKTGFLCYLILDTVINNYFPLLDTVEGEIENIEKEILRKASKRTLQKIFRLRRNLLLMRKAIWPVREMVYELQIADMPKSEKKSSVYYRDLYDHISRVIDLTETYREMLTGALETYLSTISNNMNEVMKVLTVVASLMMVPTLISGIYGMNFRYMPELGWTYGYPFALSLMAFTMLAMLIYFRRKRWI